MRTEVHASFASEKVKKMPAVKNGFKIEIQCADIVIVEMQPYYFAFCLELLFSLLPDIIMVA